MTADDPYAGFVSFYDDWASKMTEDVDLYVRRALEATGPVVELGAGTGRVSIPVAQAGRDVIAVDASEAMIERGRKKAAEAGVADRITWVQARMQTYVADPSVDLVIIPFRSFLHLLGTEDQIATLRSIGASLTPGGRLVLNFFQPDPSILAEHDGTTRRLEAEFTDGEGRSCRLWSVGRYAVATQVLSLRASCERSIGATVVEAQDAEMQLRTVYRYEFEHLLARTGFDVEALYGWFDERPFTEESREMIWVARKP